MTELKRDKTHVWQLLGFDKRDSMFYVKEDLKMDKVDILYSGKLSEVTEEQAMHWCECQDSNSAWWKEYGILKPVHKYSHINAVDSLKSATNKPFIIIIKTKL